MATGKIERAIKIIEEGTTTDNNSRLWRYRKYSDGTIDVYFTGTGGDFTFTAEQTGPTNGMYRRQEYITFSILTDILWCTATGTNSSYFLAGIQKNGNNQVILIQQGVTGTTTTLWVSIYIKGRWT